MRRTILTRAFWVLAGVGSLASLTGCPELNQWTGPAQDPFFSVGDTLVEGESQDLLRNRSLAPVEQP